MFLLRTLFNKTKPIFITALVNAGLSLSIFVPSPLSDFYEWVVLAACCLNVVFEKWAEPKNSALFESAVVCESGQKQGKNRSHEFSINIFQERKKGDRFSDGVRALGGTTGAALWPGKKPGLSKTHIHTVSFSLSHKNTCTWTHSLWEKYWAPFP